MSIKKRLYGALPYLAIAVTCGCVFFTTFGNLDELWNYSFALNIRNGLTPYRDFNMIQTPLSAYIAGAFLTVFGDGLFTFRVLSWLLLFAIHSVCYRLYLFLSGLRSVSLLMTLFGVLLLPRYYHYNSLSFLMVMLVLLRGSRRILDDSVAPPYLSALLIGLTPLIKQTTGAALLLCFIVVLLAGLRLQKINGRVLSVSLLCLVCPGALFALWLMLSHTLGDFLDYALYGLQGFTHRTSLLQFVLSSVGGLLLTAVTAVVLICVIYAAVKRRRSRRYLAFYLLMTSAFAVVAYPLCDSEHFCFVFLSLMPMVFYLITPKPLRQVERLLVKALCAAVMVCVLLLNNALLSDQNRLSSLRHYELVPINNEMEESIKRVDDYILTKEDAGERVCIASAFAVAYLLPEDIYIKDYSMLLRGNLGTQTTQQLYQREAGAIMLVWHDDKQLNAQDDVELIKTIRENGVFDDKIEGFEAYKTKPTV